MFGLSIYRSASSVGVDFVRLFLDGYFYDCRGRGMLDGVDDARLNDAVMKMCNPRLARQDALIAWMLERA